MTCASRISALVRSASGRGYELNEESGEPRLVETPLCDRDHRVVEKAFRIGDYDAVQVQEHDRSEEARSLVPVDERLILRDVERVGRRHREQALVSELAARGRAWHGDGGLQQARVAYTSGAAVLREL